MAFYDIFLTKDYLVIVLMAVVTFLLLYINPTVLQNKHYQVTGTECPDAAWHSLILFGVGTGLFALSKRTF